MGTEIGNPSRPGRRQFSDVLGRAWTVYEAAIPRRDWTSADEDTNRAEFGVGWLWFECGAYRRRLRLYPKRWDLLSDRQLERLCARGMPYDALPAEQPRDGWVNGDLRNAG